MGKITDADLQVASDILKEYPGAFIGGSYVVNEDTANDLDVVVPCFVGKTPISTDWVHTSTEVDDATKETYDGAYELVNTYRKGNVNILMIDPRFYPAYWCAVEAMKNNPMAFGTRDKRVELHVNLKERIKQWIEVATNA